MITLNEKTPELSAFLKELYALLGKHEATILANANGDLAISMQVAFDFHDFEFPGDINMENIMMDYFGGLNQMNVENAK